jgi:hypothetical protein
MSLREVFGLPMHMARCEVIFLKGRVAGVERFCCATDGPLLGVHETLHSRHCGDRRIGRVGSYFTHFSPVPEQGADAGAQVQWRALSTITLSMSPDRRLWISSTVTRSIDPPVLKRPIDHSYFRTPSAQVVREGSIGSEERPGTRPHRGLVPRGNRRTCRSASPRRLSCGVAVGHEVGTLARRDCQPIGGSQPVSRRADDRRAPLLSGLWINAVPWHGSTGAPIEDCPEFG